MVEIAREDTYGLEDVGGGVKVRRRIVAGTAIPEHYEIPGSGKKPAAAAPPGPVDTPEGAVPADRPSPPRTTKRRGSRS